MALDLNEKPWYVALIVGLVLGGAILFAGNSYLFKDQKKQIANLEESIDGLKREIEKGLRAKADLPKLEDDIRGYEIDLQRLTKILPTKKQTPALIKRLKQLTEQGFFSLNTFKPGAFIDKEYYYEWPIQVNLAGTYHQLGLFFDRLSRFSRIINVNELEISPVAKSKKDYSIKATFTQRTFVYKGEKPNGGGM